MLASPPVLVIETEVVPLEALLTVNVCAAVAPEL